MVMEDIDLGRDRSHLIDLIYGKKDAAESVTPSLEAGTTPLTETPERTRKQKTVPKKTQKSRVTCSKASIICIFLAVLFAIAFAAFAAHWLTKQNFEKQIAQLEAPHHHRRHNASHANPSRKPDIEDEGPAPAEPTREQLALPTTLSPVWYKVSLRPSRDGQSKAEGVVAVKINVTEDTDAVVVNAKGIKFTDDNQKIQILKEANLVKRQAEVEEGSGQADEEVLKTKDELAGLQETGLTVKSVEADDILEKTTLKLDGILKKGDVVVLKIPYRIRSNDSDALRAYEYKSDNGTKTIWSTQPNFAYLRHLYPSFDEETFEAPVDVTLLHEPGQTVIANVETTPDDQHSSTLLRQTVIPDFVIGDLVNNEAQTESGLQIRVWSRQQVAENTKFALDFALKAVDTLEHILQSRMNGAKLDIVGIPHFVAGSRVSNSLILLPEDLVIYDEQDEDIVAKTNVARAIANRIAAQWFGGIANPTEYGTFWLNDALPKLLEYNVLEKTLDIDAEELYMHEAEHVLQKDATATSQPLRARNVHSSAQIANIDHTLAAEKGAAVLRMIKKVVGDDVFIKAVRTFVNSHRTQHPFDDGLWNAFSKAVPKDKKGWNGKPLDVAKCVDTWVDQMGYPLLTVQRLDPEQVEITQQRFKVDNLTPEQFKFRNALFWFNWEVPVWPEIDHKKQKLQWLHEALRQPLNVSELLLLNTNLAAPARVNYETATWRKIVALLDKEHETLKHTTRARIISDAFALAEAGIIPYETALNTTSYLPKETTVLPWLAAVDALEHIVDRLRDTPLEDRFNDFVYNKLAAKFDSLNLNMTNDKYLDSVLNTKLVKFVCDINPKKCHSKLSPIIATSCLATNESSEEQCEKVPAAVRDFVYCDRIAHGDEDLFDSVREIAQNETNVIEQQRLELSLGCSRDPRLLKKLVRSLLNDTNGVVSVLQKIREQPVGDVASNFVIDNWKTLRKATGDDFESLNSIVQAAVTARNEREKNTVENFAMHHKKSTQAVEKIREKLEEATTRIRWRNVFENDIEDYLNGKMQKIEEAQEDEDDE